MPGVRMAEAQREQRADDQPNFCTPRSCPAVEIGLVRRPIGRSGESIQTFLDVKGRIVADG